MPYSSIACLGAEIELLFDFDFDPQPLAVEAVLITQLVAGHGEVTLVGVLVGASPGVMHTHGVVGCDGSVEEGPLRSPPVLRLQFAKDIVIGPEAEHQMLAGQEIGLADLFKHAIQIVQESKSADADRMIPGAGAPVKPGENKRRRPHAE